MSRLFGEMRQIAFVVRDLDRALRYWTETLGVGPFFLLRDFIPLDYLYRGEPAPRLTLALGFSGEFQIELIQQHDDHPSAYRDFLLAGHEGCLRTIAADRIDCTGGRTRIHCVDVCGRTETGADQVSTTARRQS